MTVGRQAGRSLESHLNSSVMASDLYSTFCPSCHKPVLEIYLCSKSLKLHPWDSLNLSLAFYFCSEVAEE